MKFTNVFISVMFVLMTTVTSYAQRQKIDGIAVIINNEIILVSEVNTLVDQQAIPLGIDKNKEPEKYSNLVKKIMQNLIDQKVQLVKAEEDTLVVVMDDEVNAVVEQQIQAQIQQLGSESALEEALGTPMAEIRNILFEQRKDQLMIQRLQQVVTRDVTAARPEVESFWETYKDSLPPVPLTYDLSQILRIPSKSEEVISSKRALMDSLLQLIQDGADFAGLAKKHSEDPFTAANGGDFGWLEPPTFSVEFDSALALLDTGQVSGIVRSSRGFHIIRLIERDINRFHASHIFTDLVPDADDHQRIIDELNSYRERALNGEDFNELAFNYSDDPEAANSKGNLGKWDINSLAQRLPEFMQSIDTLKAGEITEPFVTSYGYHIVKINSLTESRQMTIDQDYEYIRNLTTLQKQNEYYKKWLEDVKLKMYIEIKMSFADTTAVIKKQ